MDIEKLIWDSINALPEGCIMGRYGYHEWEPRYKEIYQITADNPVNHLPWREAVLQGEQPVAGEYLCKHCHAVGNDYNTWGDETVIMRTR